MSCNESTDAGRAQTYGEEFVDCDSRGRQVANSDSQSEFGDDSERFVDDSESFLVI